MNCCVFAELFQLFKLSLGKCTDFTHFSGDVHIFSLPHRFINTADIFHIYSGVHETAGTFPCKHFKTASHSRRSNNHSFLPLSIDRK